MKRLYMLGTGAYISALCFAAERGAGSGAKGKAADKPEDDKGSDVQKMAIVPDPDAPDADAIGTILTPGQLAGLDPLDPARDAEQAQHREDLTNMQTDHEHDNALDPVSGTPNTGVTENAALTANATGAPVSDMSGRPAMTMDDKVALPKMRQALQDAKTNDAGDETINDDEQRGWRTPLQMGISGAVASRIFDGIGGDEGPVEKEVVSAFFPETGTRYRLK